jgi:YaiO family outer membrane protein
MNCRTIIPFIHLLCFVSSIQGTTDSIFNYARNEAFATHYEKATESLNTILQIDSNHIDALLLKGNIFLWSAQYDSSEIYLTKTLFLSPMYKDAYISLIKLYTVTNNTEGKQRLLQDIKQTFFPDTTFLQQISPNYVHAQPVKSSKVTSVNYEMEFSEKKESSPWHTIQLQHLYKNSRVSVVPKVHASHRIYGHVKKKAIAFECDTYIGIHPKIALFPSVLFSPYTLVDSIYPLYSAMFGVIIVLPFKFEVIPEIRYNNYVSDDVTTLNLSISKYVSYFLLTLKNSFIPTDMRLYYSITGDIRFFIPSHDNNWLNLKFISGRSPFDPGNNHTDIYTFVAIRHDNKIRLTKHWNIRPSFEYRHEQYGKNDPYYKFIIGLGTDYNW